MANKISGYVTTWGKSAHKNDFEYISDVVLYFRHIGLEHGEWNLITCLFAHKAKDINPVLIEHMTSYFNCSENNVKKWISNLRDKGYVIMSKKKVDDQFIWTMDCSPILEKVEAFLRDINTQDNTKLNFPAFVKAQQLQLELAI